MKDVKELRECSIRVEAVQWTGGNVQDISQWMREAGAFGDDDLSVILQATEGVLSLAGRRENECSTPVGGWVVRVFLGGDGSHWFAASEKQFAGAWEHVPGPVEQLRDIADDDISESNPDLACVLRQVAEILEQDAPDHRVPQMRLVPHASIA